jgi:hypothetical protein
VLSYRENGTVDTLVISLSMRYPPNVTPDSAVYHSYVKKPTEVKFHIADPDGDIFICQVWVDSATGQPTTTILTGATSTDTQNVTGLSFDTLVVFARAIDSAGNASPMAQCTVIVQDTLKPVITEYHITPSTGDTAVRTLPCNLYVRIADDSPIDSAKFTDSAGMPIQPMSITRDSAHVLVASLDSGKHVYQVVAWDKAGNRGTRILPILYTGKVAYKFTFSNIIDRTANENVAFPAINLNNCVSISPTTGIPATWKDSIQWQILETKPDSGLKAAFSQTTKTVTFAVPDSEWSGSEAFTFIADWPNMAAGYAGATFTINPVNDPPRITWKGQRKSRLEDWDTVYADKCASDPDNPVTSLTWTQDTAVGKFFTLSWNYTYLQRPPLPPIPLWMRTWTIVSKPGTVIMRTWTGKDTLRMTVRDPSGLTNTALIPLEKY